MLLLSCPGPGGGHPCKGALWGAWVLTGVLDASLEPGPRGPAACGGDCGVAHPAGAADLQRDILGSVSQFASILRFSERPGPCVSRRCQNCRQLQVTGAPLFLYPGVFTFQPGARRSGCGEPSLLFKLKLISWPETHACCPVPAGVPAGPPNGRRVEKPAISLVGHTRSPEAAASTGSPVLRSGLIFSVTKCPCGRTQGEGPERDCGPGGG